MALTDLEVRKARVANKQQKLVDGGGLYLLVHPNGGKYWRMDYRFAGNRKLHPTSIRVGSRAACELKKIEMRYCVDPKAHQAQDFLDKLKAWKATGNVKQADWDAAIQKLELLKNVVMDPYSHPSAPNIPKQEVEQAIDAAGNFLKLASQK